MFLFPDFLPELGDNCLKNLVCVPYLCSSRLSGGLSGKNVATQSSYELEERDGFASLPRVRITPCPLQRVPINLTYPCVFISTYVSIGLYFDRIRIYNPFMTSIHEYSYLPTTSIYNFMSYVPIIVKLNLCDICYH